MEGGSKYKKGLWTIEEDRILQDYLNIHGKRNWNRVAKFTGLKRCGKSCRLRWMNYLSPNVKHGKFSDQEDDLIIRLHKLLGNRWSLIAGRIPGRTDNQVKNYWNSHLSKRLSMKMNKAKFEVTTRELLSNSGYTPNSSTNYGSNPSSSRSSIEDRSKNFVEVSSDAELRMGEWQWDDNDLYTPYFMESVDYAWCM